MAGEMQDTGCRMQDLSAVAPIPIEGESGCQLK